MIWGYWEPKNSKHYITPILGPLCKVLKLVRNHTVAQKVKWHWPSQIIQRFMKETSTGQLDGSLWDNSYCTKRKFSDPKSADWKCRPYVLKSTFLVLPSNKRNWLFEAVHAICKPFQSKNVDIACCITFYLQKTFSLVMKTELLLSINAKATSNRLGTPHRAVSMYHMSSEGPDLLKKSPRAKTGTVGFYRS